MWHKQNQVWKRIQCPRAMLAVFPISLEDLQLLKDCQSFISPQPSGMIYIPFLPFPAPRGQELACSTFQSEIWVIVVSRRMRLWLVQERRLFNLVLACLGSSGLDRHPDLRITGHGTKTRRNTCFQRLPVAFITQLKIGEEHFVKLRGSIKVLC